VKNFVQTDTYIKINSVKIPKTSKDANIIKRKVHNQKQITRYRSNDITRYEFITNMCNNFKNKVFHKYILNDYNRFYYTSICKFLLWRKFDFLMISVYKCCGLNFKIVKFITYFCEKKNFWKQRISPPRGVF